MKVYRRISPWRMVVGVGLIAVIILVVFVFARNASQDRIYIEDLRYLDED